MNSYERKKISLRAVNATKRLEGKVAWRVTSHARIPADELYRRFGYYIFVVVFT